MEFVELLYIAALIYNLQNVFMCNKLLLLLFLSMCKIKKASDDNDCCSIQFKSH